MKNIERIILQFLMGRQKQEIVDKLLKETFKVIDPKDVLRIESPNQGWFGGKELKQDDIDRLIYEGSRLKSSFLWQVLSRQLRYEASNLIAYKSKTPEDMIGGKMMLYSIEVIEELLDNLS